MCAEPDETAWSSSCSSDQCWSCSPGIPGYEQIFSIELLLPGSQVLQHTVLGVLGEKALQARKKMDFFMKTAMEESSYLIARLNFMGFELKVFRCKKPHSLSSSIKRHFCPVLMIPSRGLPSVLPSEGFLTDTPGVYAGQASVAIQADSQKETVIYNLPHYYLPYKHWGPKLKKKDFYLVSFLLKK